jgi:hypothetical protein
LNVYALSICPQVAFTGSSQTPDRMTEIGASDPGWRWFNLSNLNLSITTADTTLHHFYIIAETQSLTASKSSPRLSDRLAESAQAFPTRVYYSRLLWNCKHDWKCMLRVDGHASNGQTPPRPSESIEPNSSHPRPPRLKRPPLLSTRIRQSAGRPVLSFVLCHQGIRE